eukprot:m.1640582 g.1640582  ORF g.1640582 m.1640582 type:complete len:79 (-) comp42841_c0_seq1:430-666(-)
MPTEDSSAIFLRLDAKIHSEYCFLYATNNSGERQDIPDNENSDADTDLIGLVFDPEFLLDGDGQNKSDDEGKYPVQTT